MAKIGQKKSSGDEDVASVTSLAQGVKKSRLRNNLGEVG